MQAGDTVRVHIDTNGGWHGYVGVKGYYTDTIRKVGEKHVVLTHVSHVPTEDCEPTTSFKAQVTVKGKTYNVRMMDRGKVWWAKLPRGIEPLACEATYIDTLRRAVERLYYFNERN